MTSLAAQLSTLVDAARNAWPNVEVATPEFVRYALPRLAAADDPATALRDLHVADLYLACACASGDRRALAHFDRHVLSEVPRHVRRIDASKAFGDEVTQTLRERLFVGEAPRILEYTGKGPLGAWVRVASIRVARNLLRDAKPAQALSRADGIPELQARGPDPELGYLKAHYQQEFQAAFETTLSSLSSRERNILRLYFLEGMSSAAVAKLYDVTGATVRLWIKQWREAIMAETRRLLAIRLRADSAELDGVMDLVGSRFDLTISRLLKTR